MFDYDEPTIEIEPVDRDALARMFPDWESVPADDEVRCDVRARGARVEHGEDLPASWHQQQNGGVRRWSTASGVI